MESNVLKFGNGFQEVNLTVQHHPPPPSHHPTRPPYDENHSYYKNAALTVLGCGTLLLVIVCWSWWRRACKKEPSHLHEIVELLHNENDALMSFDMAEDFHSGNLVIDHQSWSHPHHRPSRPPPYWSQHNSAYYQYTALAVLCSGILALSIIFWRCCRTSSKKGNNGPVETTAAPGPGRFDYDEPPSTIPMPPPYNASDYDKPPPYSSVVPSDNSPPVNPNLSKCVGDEKPDEDKEDSGNTSQTPASAVAGNVHVVNIYDPKT